MRQAVTIAERRGDTMQGKARQVKNRKQGKTREGEANSRVSEFFSEKKTTSDMCVHHNLLSRTHRYMHNMGDPRK